MKQTLSILTSLLIAAAAHAECNLNLALASGHYLVELERAGLQSLQSGGACTVLDAEYKKCTTSQRKQLEAELDLREVLGNICMPHLPAPKN